MEDIEYCVIIGREIEGGCEVELCEGLDTCPYIRKEEYIVDDEETLS